MNLVSASKLKRSLLRKTPLLSFHKSYTSGFQSRFHSIKLQSRDSNPSCSDISSRMIWIGYKRPIVNDDLWDLDREDKAGRVSRHFLHVWNKEKRKCKYVNTCIQNHLPFLHFQGLTKLNKIVYCRDHFMFYVSFILDVCVTW